MNQRNTVNEDPLVSILAEVKALVEKQLIAGSAISDTARKLLAEINSAVFITQNTLCSTCPISMKNRGGAFAYNAGELIKNLRREKGITQQKIAKMSGNSVDAIRRLEIAGGINGVTLGVFLTCVKKLNVGVNVILSKDTQSDSIALGDIHSFTKEFINTCKKIAQINQAELSRALNASGGVVSRLENTNGKFKKGPTLGTLDKIAQACGVNIEFEVKQEVSHLLGNSHLQTFSCRDNRMLGFQLKEIFLGINYGEWKKGDEKILETESKKGVLDFRGIPDNYLQDSQDINSWYGVFLHVLANGISNKAEGILLHYEKDLYFRIVREIIGGEERYIAIFSMSNESI